MGARIQPPRFSIAYKKLLDHQVDGAAGDDDDLGDRLAGGAGLHLFISQSSGFDGLGVGVGGHTHHRNQLAVDLHRNLLLVFPGQFRIALRPGGAQHVALFAQFLPEFGREEGRERREHQHE